MTRTTIFTVFLTLIACLAQLTSAFWSGVLLNEAVFLISLIFIIIIFGYSLVYDRSSIIFKLSCLMILLALIKTSPLLPDKLEVITGIVRGAYPKTCLPDTINEESEILRCSQKELYVLGDIRTLLFQQKGSALKYLTNDNIEKMKDSYSLGRRTKGPVKAYHVIGGYYTIYTNEESVE